jgi:predicted Zn-dependent protease
MQQLGLTSQSRWPQALRRALARLSSTRALFFLSALLSVGYPLIHAPSQTKTTASARHARPELDLRALTEPLKDLTPSDRDTIDRAVALIKQKQHLLALAYLTGLTQRNPDNSAVRVLRAYVLLELGNLSGALEDADAAEISGAHAAYKCWFLAQVAYLAGNKPLCRREIKHIGNDPTYGPRAEQLRRELGREPE